MRSLLITAVAVYLAVIGCVLIPGGTDRPAVESTTAASIVSGGVKLEGMPLRGIAFTVHNLNDTAPYRRVIDEIAAVGADTVEIVIAGRQENGSSSNVFIDQRYTPSREQLLELMAHARSKQLRIMLMPIVLLQQPKGNEWRGTIKPDLWADWFDSYRGFITHYAGIAAAGDADVLVVGSELVSSEVHAAEWRKVIAEVRSVFKGMLTYSANWDHFSNIPFWDQLDFIGMNSYWKLGENQQVPVTEIMARWKQIQKELIEFSNLKRKPIVLCEVGWCSISNAAHEPWDYTKTDLSPDWELQRKLYEGFFKSWYGHPNLGGFMVWEWHPGDVAANDKSYIPKGKPAFDILKEWMAKEPWEVK